MKDKYYYVYVIQCKDGLYYTGLANDISDRYAQHLSGLGPKFTSIHGVSKLVYVECYNDFDVARYREKQIKNWNRQKKEKLISGFWGKIE